MSRANIPQDVLNELDPRLAEWLKQYGEEAFRPLSIVPFTFTSANTEYRIRHLLPHVPRGYKVIDRSAPGVVYTSKKPDEFYLYLKSDTAGLNVVLEVS